MSYARFARKRQIFETVFLNFSLDGVSLAPEWRMPFEVLNKRLGSEKSWDDKIPIELFQDEVAKLTHSFWSPRSDPFMFLTQYYCLALVSTHYCQKPVRGFVIPVHRVLRPIHC